MHFFATMTSMDKFIMENGIYIQLAAMICLYIWLGIALLRQRLSRHIFELMNTEIDSDSNSDTHLSHTYDQQTKVGGITEWEQLSAEDKLEYKNKDAFLNRLSVIPGLLAILSSMLWYQGEIMMGGMDTDLNVTIIMLGFLIGLYYYVRNHYDAKN